MFRVTVDIFSGRPNPSWIVTDSAESDRVLEVLAEERTLMSKPDAGFQGLGYRGVHIELFGDDATQLKIPPRVVIANGAENGNRSGFELAARLIENMTRFRAIVLPEHAITPLDARMQEQLLERLREFERNPPVISRSIVSGRGIRVTVRDKNCSDCQYEESRFNPAFWNADPNVRQNNNCYNYARNWRTNTFAQPGRASGDFPNAMDCGDVHAAAMSDGLKKRCDCLPPDEQPRRLVALVVDPGFDYHWYRKQKDGFWGHKPGSTAAKNTDNSGSVITNPETCDRGGYTDFCGYLYAGKSVHII